MRTEYRKCTSDTLQADISQAFSTMHNYMQKFVISQRYLSDCRSVSILCRVSKHCKVQTAASCTMSSGQQQMQAQLKRVDQIQRVTACQKRSFWGKCPPQSPLPLSHQYALNTLGSLHHADSTGPAVCFVNSVCYCDLATGPERAATLRTHHCIAAMSGFILCIDCKRVCHIAYYTWGSEQVLFG